MRTVSIFCVFSFAPGGGELAADLLSKEKESVMHTWAKKQHQQQISPKPDITTFTSLKTTETEEKAWERSPCWGVCGDRVIRWRDSTASWTITGKKTQTALKWVPAAKG